MTSSLLHKQSQDSKDVDLGSIWLFSACSKRQLQILRRHFDEIKVVPGAVLCTEGEAGNWFFVIVSGIARVERNGKLVTKLGPGDYFGELALLDRKERSASVIAETDMVLLTMEVRHFHGVIEEMPGLAHRLMEALAARLRAADAKIYG
jgi:CRP/FNR family cyclic AMP-dependent transcriptional regulator